MEHLQTSNSIFVGDLLNISTFQTSDQFLFFQKSLTGLIFAKILGPLTSQKEVKMQIFLFLHSILEIDSNTCVCVCNFLKICNNKKKTCNFFLKGC